MADFTLAQIGEETGGASPQPGVQEPNPITTAVQFASGIGSSLFSAMQATAEAEKLAQTNKALTRFSQQQMTIADLVDQGRMTSQEGRMRMRRNLIRAGGDNPNLSQDLAEVHKTVISTAGMGKVAEEGTEQEQAQFAAQAAATKDGFVLPTMTQGEAAEATVKWQQFQHAQAQLEREAKLAALRNSNQAYETGKITQGTARITQQSAALALEENKAAWRARNALMGMADGAGFRFQQITQDLQRRVDNNEISREEAAQRIDEEWSVLATNTQAIGRGADPTIVSSVLAPLENIYNLRRGYITGTTTAETLDAGVALELSRLGSVIVADPRNAPILAISNIVGENTPGLVAEMSQVAQRALRMNTPPDGRSADVTDPAESEDMSTYFRALQGAISKANQGDLRNEGTVGEINNNLNHILDSVGVHGAAIESPAELNLAINFIASEGFGQYAEGNSAAIDRDRLRRARIAYQEQYDNVVKPLVLEEYRNAQVQVREERGAPGPGGVDPGREPATDLIRPSFSGGNLEFVSVEDDPSRKTLAKIRDLNTRVAPIVERLIYAGAHLELHRDYQKIYDSQWLSSLIGDTAEE